VIAPILTPLLFGWYKGDFGGDDPSVGRFMAAYYPDGAEKRLLLSGRFRAVETAYDWTLDGLDDAKTAR
jgi:hypothetical protein